MDNYTESSIIIRNDSIFYDTLDTELDVVSFSELILKFISNSNTFRAMSNLMDVEIVAVMLKPYGKHSVAFKKHHSNSFHTKVVSTALSKIESPAYQCTIQNGPDGRLQLEIPIFLNQKCIGYMVAGWFYMSEDSAGINSDIPVIKPSKVEYMAEELCGIGRQIMYDCHKSLQTNSADFKYNNDDLFKYGNFFDYDLILNTYVLSKKIVQTLGLPYKPLYKSNDFLDIVVDEEKDRILQFYRQNILLGDTDFVLETSIKHPDGHIADIEISATIIKNGNGIRIRMIGSITDVTELKNVQKNLRKEIANKNRLIKIIGHDLRNPFNGLIGFSEILHNNLRQKNYDEAEEIAGIIKQSASEGYDLLINLIDYSNYHSGNVDTIYTEFDIYKIVDSILKLSSAQALKKCITLYSRIPQNTIIFSDENKINTILRNLISNAIKFCYEDGIVLIDIEVRAHNTLYIYVSDTGNTIPDDKLADINKGVEVKSTNGTACENGTSIGLTLCHYYLKLLGSHLIAKCDDGVTTFGFEIKNRNN